jgi:outer membrane protein OmpA-like peptidoglycan-associated protein
LNDAQRRESELRASQSRADSASAWLLDKVNAVAQSAGLQIEMEWKGFAAVAVHAVGVGASDLAQPPATERDRLNNCRIEFLVNGKPY